MRLFTSILLLLRLLFLHEITGTSIVARSSPLSIPDIPLCVPPSLLSPITGQYPPSAVTRNQTGKHCTQYGNAPATILNDVVSPDGLLDIVTLCEGEVVTLKDNLDEERKACFYAHPNSTYDKPLPLLIWLHPSLVSASLTWPLTGWDAVKRTQPLNNEDSSAIGFSYILPFGRNTVHNYPVPDQSGLGWDNWYRNFDRSSPQLNADIDFIDKAIARAKELVPVDARRVYMSGWSNGAAMALQYALQTDGIAAASVYSAPDPYRDLPDPCAQDPRPSFGTPTADVHNYCDLWGICTTGKYFYDDLKRRYPRLRQSLVVIDTITTKVKSRDDEAECDPVCQGICSVNAGTVAHLRWPTSRNDDAFFSFFLNHPLPRSGSWGPP